MVLDVRDAYPRHLRGQAQTRSERAQGAGDGNVAPRVRWKADNYNHLFEQPTVFYAVTLSLAVIGHGDGINAALAWAYVGLRVAHSLLQALWNNIKARFTVFTLSAFTLMALTIQAAREVF